MIKRDVKLLMEEQALRSVCVSPMEEVVTTTYSEASYQVAINGKPLVTSRGEVRRFARMDTVMKFMQELGITEFTVRLKNER